MWNYYPYNKSKIELRRYGLFVSDYQSIIWYDLTWIKRWWPLLSDRGGLTPTGGSKLKSLMRKCDFKSDSTLNRNLSYNI
jgi:hypothetical protein